MATAKSNKRQDLSPDNRTSPAEPPPGSDSAKPTADAMAEMKRRIASVLTSHVLSKKAASLEPAQSQPQPELEVSSPAASISGASPAIHPQARVEDTSEAGGRMSQPEAVVSTSHALGAALAASSLAKAPLNADLKRILECVMQNHQATAAAPSPANATASNPAINSLASGVSRSETAVGATSETIYGGAAVSVPRGTDVEKSANIGPHSNDEASLAKSSLNNNPVTSSVPTTSDGNSKPLTGWQKPPLSKPKGDSQADGRLLRPTGGAASGSIADASVDTPFCTGVARRGQPSATSIQSIGTSSKSGKHQYSRYADGYPLLPMFQNAMPYKNACHLRLVQTISLAKMNDPQLILTSCPDDERSSLEILKSRFNHAIDEKFYHGLFRDAQNYWHCILYFESEDGVADPYSVRGCGGTLNNAVGRALAKALGLSPPDPVEPPPPYPVQQYYLGLIESLPALGKEIFLIPTARDSLLSFSGTSNFEYCGFTFNTIKQGHLFFMALFLGLFGDALKLLSCDPMDDHSMDEIGSFVESAETHRRRVMTWYPNPAFQTVLELCRAKFQQGPHARQALLDSGDYNLIEEVPNKFFGSRLDNGLRPISLILMSIRENLRRTAKE